MIIPPYLKQGDQVAIISSARSVTFEEIASSVEILTSWGLKVVFGTYLFEKKHQMAGSVEQRREDLQWAIDDPHLNAIFMARGGYGTVQIVDKVNFELLKQYPKWLCGFSDVTILHSQLHTMGLESIHSTMPVLYAKATNNSLVSLYNCLFGHKLSIESGHSTFNQLGLSTGPLVGGNLSLLVSMIGTNSDINTEGKILFLEDIDEYLYHIDRMMQQLNRAGKLSKLKGLVIGQMTDLKDNAVPFGETVEEIVLKTTADYHYPICFNFPAGHSNENLALKLGTNYELNVSTSNVTLTEI